MQKSVFKSFYENGRFFAGKGNLDNLRGQKVWSGLATLAPPRWPGTDGPADPGLYLVLLVHLNGCARFKHPHTIIHLITTHIVVRNGTKSWAISQVFSVTPLQSR